MGEGIADRAGGTPATVTRRGKKARNTYEKMELNPGELMRHFRELWGHEPEVRQKKEQDDANL